MQITRADRGLEGTEPAGPESCLQLACEEHLFLLARPLQNFQLGHVLVALPAKGEKPRRDGEGLNGPRA